VRQYLPDYDEEPEKKIPREFLFSIVNKLDPTFFSRAAKELAPKKKTANDDEKIRTLKIQPELMNILREANDALRLNRNANSSRALSSMLTTTKKRQRREVTGADDGITTDIDQKRMKR